MRMRFFGVDARAASFASLWQERENEAPASAAPAAMSE
jgi:hypothetical protein